MLTLIIQYLTFLYGFLYVLLVHKNYVITYLHSIKETNALIRPLIKRLISSRIYNSLIFFMLVTSHEIMLSVSIVLIIELQHSLFHLNSEGRKY